MTESSPIRRGELWLVAPVGFPKPRPAIVISIDPVNDLCPDVLLVPVTSQPGPLRIELTDAAERTGLVATSYAKCESVGPVHKSSLKRRIGTLSRDGLRAVAGGVRRVLGL
ncbi:MAG TPA: type II toxin-antitoxin system PemK/MazF family toxin [Thermoanaerobaculia bacterium]|nr:type II toxin-antitoxin system PemK/MazF family toxin [Thermoanaerobaculia bacterium]